MNMQTLHLKPRAPTLSASRLKIMTTLIPSGVLGIPAPNGTPRVNVRINLPDRTLTADIVAKSLRKAQTAIREIGGDGIVVMLQGLLVAGDKIAEAGLSEQPKAQMIRPFLIRLLFNSTRRLTPQSVGRIADLTFTDLSDPYLSDCQQANTQTRKTRFLRAK